MQHWGIHYYNVVVLHNMLQASSSWWYFQEMYSAYTIVSRIYYDLLVANNIVGLPRQTLYKNKCDTFSWFTQ